MILFVIITLSFIAIAGAIGNKKHCLWLSFFTTSVPTIHDQSQNPLYSISRYYDRLFGLSQVFDILVKKGIVKSSMINKQK